MKNAIAQLAGGSTGVSQQGAVDTFVDSMQEIQEGNPGRRPLRNRPEGRPTRSWTRQSVKPCGEKDLGIRLTAYSRGSIIIEKKKTEEMVMDYSKMTEEALEILRRDWPEYNKATEQTIKDGDSLVDWLEILESFA